MTNGFAYEVWSNIQSQANALQDRLGSIDLNTLGDLAMQRVENSATLLLYWSIVVGAISVVLFAFCIYGFIKDKSDDFKGFTFFFATVVLAISLLTFSGYVTRAKHPEIHARIQLKQIIMRDFEIGRF